VVRFSTVAAAAVAGLWVTGVIQAWFTVGSLNGLVDSDYGMILLVKLVVVVATMAMAAWNRWKLLPALADPVNGPVDGPVDGPAIAPATVVTRVGRTVRLEVVTLLVVVLITSVLVETPPATTAVMEAQPFNQTLPLTEGVDLNVLVTPGSVGLNEIHITYIDNQGLLDDRVESVVVEMNLPAEGIGPIPANGATLLPGHYLVTTENLAVAGVWRLDIVSRVGLFDQLRTTFEVPNR
jgi:copper transport protein